MFIRVLSTYTEYVGTRQRLSHDLQVGSTKMSMITTDHHHTHDRVRGDFGHETTCVGYCRALFRVQMFFQLFFWGHSEKVGLVIIPEYIESWGQVPV